MAKKPKPTKKPSRTPQSAQPSAPLETTPTSEPLVKRSARQIVKRLADSGIDFLLDNFWWGVVFVMTSIGTAIWLYIRSGGAGWLYPYLYFVLGFLVACLALIAMYGLLFYVQARRRKALERAKKLEFTSQEKGFLDHKVNLQKGIKEFASTLGDIGKVINQIGETSGRAGAKFSATQSDLGPSGDALRLRIASRTAAKLNSHSSKLEQHLVIFENISTLLFESNVGYLMWAVPNEQDKQQLLNLRFSLNDMLDKTHTSIATTGDFRVSLDPIRGVSQDLNTAVNRLAFVVDGVIAALHTSVNHWGELINIIDQNLDA